MKVVFALCGLTTIVSGLSRLNLDDTWDYYQRERERRGIEIAHQARTIQWEQQQRLYALLYIAAGSVIAFLALIA